jgi:hypothetical protein
MEISSGQFDVKADLGLTGAIVKVLGEITPVGGPADVIR